MWRSDKIGKSTEAEFEVLEVLQVMDAKGKCRQKAECLGVEEECY